MAATPDLHESLDRAWLLAVELDNQRDDRAEAHACERGFCRKHRSHFCPCAFPPPYEGSPGRRRLAAAWDNPSLAVRIWRPRRNSQGEDA